MSLQFRITDQLLKVDDNSDDVEALVHKYDAFLNLLSSGTYSFQRDAIRESFRFLISPKYSDLERLARENWSNNNALSHRHDNIDSFLEKMPLKDCKAASLDLATGAGKSFVMYGIAAIALAEGLVDRVLVLCPSLTIEEGLLGKFTSLAGDSKLAEILKELDAQVPIPAIKRGTETIQPGDICVENIHAVYAKTGSSIADSFKGNGSRTLVLNDEAHHLFSPSDSGESSMKEWLKFLVNTEYDFRYMIHVTGTPYAGDEYFPDVIYRFGIKQAIELKVVKKPDYVTEDTHKAQSWDKTYAVHQQNWKDYGTKLRPISIIITQDIAGCVEVWKELIDYLVKKEKISPEEAEEKAIWVTSGIPSAKAAKARVESAYEPRGDKDSPDKRRKENLAALKKVDEPSSSVEWIVSVSMLTEGWDVKNVFQIVPHESRAFASKLLISQVLGRGLRVPSELDVQPLVKITNHEAWSEEIANLIKEVLEVENTLSWGYDSRREEFVIPLHNLKYEPAQQTVETKKEKATKITLTLKPQSRKSTEYATFSETGKLAVEITHNNLVAIDDAVRMLRLFIRDKDEVLATKWPKSKIKKFIEDALKKGGYDTDYLSRENLTLVQQAFGPLFRPVGREHPRMTQVAKELVDVDYRNAPRQSFSESRMKEHGAVYHVTGDDNSFDKDESLLWDQYSKWVQIAQIDESGLNDSAREIAKRIHQIDAAKYKSPNNIHYASHEPERKFSDLLFENSELVERFTKIPDRGVYSFPYSYKPAKTGKTHTVNEQFNPDFAIQLKDSKIILIVEIKQEGDDGNRNKAKFRDGMAHFKALNAALVEAGKPWQYHFYFLSPEDYVGFFDQIRNDKIDGWHSSLMQELGKA
ncbi:DEAD/DEAH box helicase family protein [Deltaproteobacteria bacterium IMCC39524]|nr:DEAD/DEAH box helicase family protein [Deltaproteobacteria bacterium IMCC39524]